MPTNRFYIPTSQNSLNQPFKIEQIITIKDKELHHLSKVMRASINEEVELIDGKGKLAIAKIIELKKREALLKITSIKQEPPPTFQIILAQAIPKLNRLDFILEKSTEIGATAIWLFPGVLSEKKELSNNQIERIQNILISAIKQCGRLHLPELIIQPPLDKWSPLHFPAFYGSLNENAPRLHQAWKEARPEKGVFFFIGPESGFHEREEKQLKDANFQASGVKLHCNILRTDTASLVALSAVEQILHY